MTCGFPLKCGNIEATSVLSRFLRSVNNHLKDLLTLRNRINSSLHFRNVIVVFMHHFLELPNQFWLNARVDSATDVALIGIIITKMFWRNEGDC